MQINSEAADELQIYFGMEDKLIKWLVCWLGVELKHHLPAVVRLAI